MTGIRSATQVDIPPIRIIRDAVRENRLSHPDKVTADDVACFIERCGMWAWEEDGVIAGFSAGDSGDGSIWALFVDPSYESRGIGRALIDAACRTVKAAGHAMATLSTDPGTRAERFYRRNGWVAGGFTQGGEMIFSKNLGGSSTPKQ